VSGDSGISMVPSKFIQVVLIYLKVETKNSFFSTTSPFGLREITFEATFFTIQRGLPTNSD
jgi:hypothetical protein